MVLYCIESPNPAWLMGSHSGLGFEWSGPWFVKPGRATNIVDPSMSNMVVNVTLVPSQIPKDSCSYRPEALVGRCFEHKCLK